MDSSFRAKLAFAVLWFGVQAVLVLSGARRPDGVFAFRMFPESSTIAISLSRELRDGRTLEVHDGRWIARGRDGAPHDVAWGARVKDPVLSNLDVTVHAAYGADAQLTRLQAALDDVLAHSADDDGETRALVASVVVRRNGREPSTVVLRSGP